MATITQPCKKQNCNVVVDLLDLEKQNWLAAKLLKDFSVLLLSIQPTLCVSPGGAADTKYVNIDGYYGDIWAQMQKVLNFTYWVLPTVDGAWGSKLENGSWNGMIGMILLIIKL
jgi:hypothetical protein